MIVLTILCGVGVVPGYSYAADGSNPIPDYPLSSIGLRTTVMTVDNDTDTPVTRVLSLGVPDVLSLLVVLDGGNGQRELLRLEEGAPFAARPLLERMLAVPFTLNGGERAVLTVSYQIHGANPLLATVTTPERFHQRLAQANLIDGMIFGLLSALVVIALLQFLVNRQTALLAYAGLAAAMMAFLSQIEGYNFAYLWPECGGWNNWAPVVLIIALQAAHVMFTLSVFDLRQSPRLRTAYGVYGVSVAVGVGFYIAGIWPMVSLGAAMAYGPLALVTGIIFMRRGRTIAAYYLAGSLAYALFNNVLFVLTLFGYFQGTDPFLYPRIGFVVEPLLFAVALAYHTRGLRLRLEEGLRLRLAEARQLADAEAEKSRALAAAQRGQMQLAATGHDLAQPLSSIRFALTALRLQRGDDAAVHHIDRILDHSEALLRSLIEEARQGAAEAQGRLELGAVLAEASRRHQPAATAKGLRLRCCPSSIQIDGSAVVLTRIIDNLAANAIRYTGRGGVLMGVRRRFDGTEIQVVDTGPGLDAATSKQILAPFIQGGQGAAGREGYGLGLHIVQTLCEGAGYRLNIHSVPGRGSIFSVLIPS